MMKRFAVPLLAGVMVAILIFAGCAQPAPTTPAEPTTPTAPTTPAAPTTPTAPTTPSTPACSAAPSWAPTSDNPFAGIGLKPDGTQYWFAFSPVFTMNDYGVCWCGLFESYCEKAGMKVTIHDPAGDAMMQFSMIEDLIGKKPDAVAMAPVEPESMVPLVERLAEAGIPSFACDLQLRSPDLVCNVRNDPHAMGEAAGLYITDCAEELGEPLTAYVIYGMLSMITQAPPRGQGFKDAVAATDLVTSIDGPDCGWVEPQACDAVMAAFAAHPEYNAVYEMGAMCGGVVEGLRAIDRLYPIGDPNHVICICNDESKSVIEHIESGYVDGAVTHSAHKDIDTMFKAMLTHVILGQDVAKTIIVPSSVLSSKDIGTDEWLESWGYLMLHEVPWDEWPIGEWGLIPTPTPEMCK